MTGDERGADAGHLCSVGEHGECIPCTPWQGQWSLDDPNANFKAEVRLHAHLDPRSTLDALARSVGLPTGAVVHFALCRYATWGSGGILEIGPSMIERLWEPIARADATDDDGARLDAYAELRSLIAWLRAPLGDEGEQAASSE